MSLHSNFKSFKRTECFFVMLMWYYNFPAGKLKSYICNVVVLTEFCRNNCGVRGFHVEGREAPEDGRRDCHQKVTGELLEPCVREAFNTPLALYLLTPVCHS